MVELEITDEYKEFIEPHEKFADLTVNGEHGITAKFLLTYCSFVELYKLFSRSVRTNDLNLFIYSPEFFVLKGGQLLFILSNKRVNKLFE